MGAEFNSIYVKSSDTKKVIKAFNKKVKDDQYEYGHGGYTGTFAEVNDIIIKSNMKPFDSIREADEWLDENCEKWENAIAVPIMVKGKITYLIGALCSN